jgi:hypothetical protein
MAHTSGEISETSTYIFEKKNVLLVFSYQALQIKLRWNILVDLRSRILIVDNIHTFVQIREEELKIRLSRLCRDD